MQCKCTLYRQLRGAPALPSHLPDVTPPLSLEEIRRRLKLVQQQQSREVRVTDGSTDLDI